MKELVGKKIERILVSPDDDFLLFHTDMGQIGYVTYGDCCSQTWFADILGVDALLNGRVASVEDVDLPDYNIEDGRCRQAYDKVYCYKVRTDKGYADIVFRNSSNGYYGGWADLTMEKEPEGMLEITEDWHAD